MNNFETKYIYSSGLFVSEQPLILNTVLGSCVAVCLWDSKNKIGGMNHYMLPYWNGNGLASPKYGNIAITRLINKMIALQGSPQNMLAKIFGGAKMLQEQSNVFDIGRRNIELAHEILSDQKIRIVAESTGGEKGRKIFFNTNTGEVFQRLL